MNQEEIETLHRPITKFPVKKKAMPDGLTGKFYQRFKEELTVLLKFFQTIEEEGTLPKSFNKMSIPWYQSKRRVV